MSADYRDQCPRTVIEGCRRLIGKSLNVQESGERFDPFSLRHFNRNVGVPQPKSHWEIRCIDRRTENESHDRSIWPLSIFHGERSPESNPVHSRTSYPKATPSGTRTTFQRAAQIRLCAGGEWPAPPISRQISDAPRALPESWRAYPQNRGGSPCERLALIKSERCRHRYVRRRIRSRAAIDLPAQRPQSG